MKRQTISLIELLPVLLLTLLPSYVAGDEQQAVTDPLAGVAGTFIRSGVNTDGVAVAVRRVIEPMKTRGMFLQTRTATPSDGSAASQWKFEMKIEPLNGRMLRYRVLKHRKTLPESEATDWRTNEDEHSMVGTIQVRGNFHYSASRLTEPAKIWVRETDDFATLDADSLRVLEPLTKTYVGKYESQGTAAYNANASSVTVKCTGRANSTGTVVSFDWTMHADKAPEKRTFEAHAICMFDSSTGKIVSHIYNSVGVVMKAELVRARDGKLLWERTGQAPAGEIRELCLFDFSETGVFRHRIVSRTLNGAVIDKEEGDIVLRVQEAPAAEE